MRQIKVSESQKRARARSKELYQTNNARVAPIENPLDVLREIEIICTESQAECHRRMGTRVGNILVLARAALAALG